ncbi:hypothetical protein [Streptomyces rubellomurinus]|uniref:Excreted virulence factor EspC, type VII ESX diderm n=1 Tax=Streptomyces rubellomurinus (strain ATCC 31215) TaxID=359131 RepID=A0A0F2TIJ8_STRR3|nr:hypothetical protein [Streptomyces rubellomurinus]KJS63068.1 hypothetical protein VM95_04935 [Streptomyces rubellomurinus]
MAEGSGYTIEAGGVEKQAKALDKAAGDQGKLHRSTVDPVCYGDNVFGGEDADPAYRNFSTAWHDETDVLASALKELADKVRGSAGHYRKAENTATTGLHQAATGGDPRPFG